jgi:DNA-binding PadR family transcriptional regulator
MLICGNGAAFILAQKDMYGYEMIVIYIKKEGMLYPALKRLEEKEYLNSYRKDS